MKNKSRKKLSFIIITIIGIIVLPKFTHVDIAENEQLEGREELNKIEEIRKPEKTKASKTNKVSTEKVKESFVFAEITNDSTYYDNYSDNKKVLGTFRKDETVEIIRDRSYQWYYVKSKDGRKGWVFVNNLLIPDDPETNEEQMTKDEIEAFVNNKGLESDTNYLVWVDIDRQLTHVFLGEKGSWELNRTMLSSTGKNISPTIKGLFKTQDRGEWFYTERLNSGAKYWVRFDGSYLFHSLPMDKQGNITDKTLGKRSSAGCIRMSLEDSQWFYKYVEESSTVFVN